MTRARNPYLGIMAAAAGITAAIEGLARRRGDALDANVPMFGLLLSLPAAAATRATAGALNRRGGTGTWPAGWVAWSVAATVASATAAVGTRVAAARLRPPRLEQQPYNYRHFHYGFYDRPRPDGVATSLVDAKVTDLDGNPVRLPDLVGARPLVIEFGSISCPIYTNKITETNEVARRHAGDADFAVLYTREAHPGATYDAIESLESKRRHAADTARLLGENRRLLVDDVEGTVHRQYGAFPNSMLVVGTDGVVSCWAEWTTPELMQAELERLLAAGGRGQDVDQALITYNFARPGAVGTDLAAFLRAGLRSLADFMLALPRMAVGRAMARFPGVGQRFRIV